MAKLKKVRKRFDEINVIPFIDIMLVLLVMVLTTATFVNQGIIPIELPEAKTADKKQDNKEEVTIYIDAKGDIFFEKDKVDLKTLEERLISAGNEQVILLKSDKESRFQDFVSVMDILKRLNHEQLFIITKE